MTSRTPRVGDPQPSWKALADLVDTTTELLADGTLISKDQAAAVEKVAWAVTRMQRWQSYVTVLVSGPDARTDTGYYQSQSALTQPVYPDRIPSGLPYRWRQAHLLVYNAAGTVKRILNPKRPHSVAEDAVYVSIDLETAIDELWRLINDLNPGEAAARLARMTGHPRVFTITIAGVARHDGEKAFTYLAPGDSLFAAARRAYTWHRANQDREDLRFVRDETFEGEPSGYLAMHVIDLRRKDVSS